MSRLRFRRIFLLSLGMTVTALAVAAYEGNLLRSLDLRTVDARFSIRGTQKPPKNIVLVLVDARTLHRLRYAWPFPRAVHAQVIDDIVRDGARTIAFDVLLSSRSCTPTPGNPSPEQGRACLQDETAIASALISAPGKVVVAVVPTGNQFDFLGSTKGGELLAATGAPGASTFFPYDAGGVIRRMVNAEDGVPTLALATAEVAGHRPIERERFRGPKGAWIDYAGPAGTFPSVSYSSVYLRRLPRGFFNGKIVVIGASAPSLGDVHPTSTSARMSGAEVQANAIATVLRGLPLRSVGGWLNIALIVLLALAAPLAGLRIGPNATILLAAVLAAAFLAGAQVAFDNDHVVTVVYPLAALLLGTAGALAVHVRSLLAMTVSAVASLSVDKQNLQGELRTRIRELEQSRSRMLDVSLRERQGIERDLHDGAQQRFVSLAITLGLLERRLSDREEGGPLLASAREQLDLGLAELRELARGIHPAVLTDGGLGPAIEALADRAPLPVRVLEVPDERLPANVEIAVYYIVAEALTNSAKHAHAHAASVRITHDQLGATIEVSDDGVGGADPARGSGLRGLADRVAAVDGRLTVDSPRGEGTRIHARIPCA